MASGRKKEEEEEEKNDDTGGAGQGCQEPPGEEEEVTDHFTKNLSFLSASESNKQKISNNPNSLVFGYFQPTF